MRELQNNIARLLGYRCIGKNTLGGRVLILQGMFVSKGRVAQLMWVCLEGKNKTCRRGSMEESASVKFESPQRQGEAGLEAGGRREPASRA